MQVERKYHAFKMFRQRSGGERGTQSIRTRLGLPTDAFSFGTEQDIFRENAVTVQESVQLGK